MKVLSVVGYLVSIVFANLLVIWFGVVQFGPLMFPAGAVMIGLCFSFRDLVQKFFGKYKCWFWMIIALVITLFFSKEVAFASGVAFLTSEVIDWVVFTYSRTSVRKRMILSNFVSLPLDSLIFVPLVFGWYWQPIVGQAIVKIVCSLLIIPFIKERK